MIKITNLSKIYDGETPTYALDNINLSFEDKGMVFIIGKSGSGKSTLLNMLAGFDMPSLGTIKFLNKDLKEYSQYELDNYRNSTIGFIFQDFCLVESLTIYQNIKMAYDFSMKKSNKETIEKILDKVEMKEYIKRYPKQLSAGQKQRIAIARAIAKNAKIILADEPTGNLDNKTTIQILDLLKQISKDRLVIVVSHNKEDAYKYADRIIELGSGKILSDKKINLAYDNEFKIENNLIMLPNNLRLNAIQLQKINDSIKATKGKIKIAKCPEKFIENNNDSVSSYNYETKKTKMGLFNMFKYSYLLFKNQIFSFLIIVLIVTFLVTTLSISIQFASYDGSLQYDQAMNNSDTTVVFLKQDDKVEDDDAYLTEYYMNRYDSSTDQIIINQYNTNPYKIVNICLPITSNDAITYKWNTTTSGMYKGAISKVNNLVICDIDYLNSLFADKNGNINYIGNLNDNNGIIITDFVADRFLKSTKLGTFSSYQQIIETDEIFLQTGINISAIIITDYKDKYGDMLTENDSEQTNQQALTADVYDILLYQYGVAYTLNDNYYDTYINNAKQYISEFGLYQANYKYNDKNVVIKDHVIAFEDTLLKDNEVMLTYSLYNKLCNTSFSPSNINTFAPNNIAFESFDFNENLIYSNNIKVIGLTTNKNYFSSNMKKDIIGNCFYQVGISILNASGDVIINAPEYGLYIANSRISVVKMAIRVVRVFKDLFTLLSCLLIIAIIVIILLNSVTTINKNIYNIGICRSMGAHMGELGFIYSSQMVIFGILTIILSMICDFYSTGIINEIIVNNISKIISVSGVREIDYVVFNPAITTICTSLVVILTIVSILIPIYTIKKMNPVNIIKSRE